MPQRLSDPEYCSVAWHAGSSPASKRFSAGDHRCIRIAKEFILKLGFGLVLKQTFRKLQATTAGACASLLGLAMCLSVGCVRNRGFRLNAPAGFRPFSDFLL